MTLTVGILTGGSNSHQTTSEEANAVATDFIGNGVVGAITNTSGVAPTTGAFAVNAQGSPNMTVAVSSGVAYVAGTPTSQNSQKVRVKNSATANVTIAANASGSTKYDWVYLSLNATKLANPAVGADDVATLVTSRSSNASTDDGTPPTYGYNLGVVTVANGASSITNGNIADKRTTTGAISGDATILPYQFSGNSAQGGTQATSWAWQSWTPTWTNLTVGSGTTVAVYSQIGKTVHFHLRFTLGSGSAVSSNPKFSLPVTASSNYLFTGGLEKVGIQTHYEDAGVSSYFGLGYMDTATTCSLVVFNAASTFLANAAVSSTSPFTWGSTDYISVAGSYEAV